MVKYLLGVDIGTTATKMVLIHKDGEIVQSISRSRTLLSTQSGWAEEDPLQWIENVDVLIPEICKKANINPKQISAIGVSGMVPTLICLARNGRPLRNSIQQNDARAWKEIDALSKQLKDYPILQKTGSEITQ